jgi:hypothetical protein
LKGASASALLWLLLAAACLDTELIPADELSSSSEGGAAVAEAGQPASEGGTPTGGGVTAAGRGGGAAGSPLSGASTAGGAVSSGGSGGAGVSWLALQGNVAPTNDPANGELGIDGHFYAYADGCATLAWDETSRCATGKLCDSLGGENWGVAIGFDFVSSHDIKLTWDPRDVSALGVAFELHGSAPGLQLWVLNMDPIWNGECSAMTCEIAGPPDGRRSLPLAGQLLFDTMQKDDWGGGGIRYEYDPAAVHALQFKLPSIEVGAASFSFCLDALGIVR